MSGIGTLVQIPVIGTLANVIGLLAPHCLILFCGVVSLVTALLFFKKKISKVRLVNLVLALVALVTSSISTLKMTTALKEAGADVSLLKSFTPEKTDKVTVDPQTYTTSELGDIALNVYTVEDGKTDKPVMLYIHGGGWIMGDQG